MTTSASRRTRFRACARSSRSLADASCTRASRSPAWTSRSTRASDIPTEEEHSGATSISSADRPRGPGLMAVDPDTERLLRHVDQIGAPDIEQMSLDEARRSGSMRAVIDSLGDGAVPSPVEVARVSDHRVPTPGGPITVRVYEPLGAGDGPPPCI